MARRFISNDVPARVGRVFYPISIAAVLVVLITTYLFLEPTFAVFGLYALLGLGASAAVYYGTDNRHELLRLRINASAHRTAVFVVCALTVGLVALTQEPMLVVGGLVLGYALVVRQLFGDQPSERLVPQMTALFLLSPITKYLTAGGYIGHGDILVHMRLVEDVLAAGSLDGISYASYQQFPGLQLLVGTVSSLTGLGSYDGLMLTGIAVYAVLIPAVYLLVVRLTGQPTVAIFTALAIAILDDISFYASYVFPQSIAMVLIVVLALLVSLASKDAIKWQATAAFALVAVALTLTHHLTQVLFVPVIGLGLLVYALQGGEHAKRALIGREMALLLFALVLTGVRLVQTGLLDRLAANAELLLAGGARGGYTQSLSLGFGRPPHSSSVSTAIEWLVSPYGAYLILLVLVFSIGIIGFLRARGWSVTQRSLFVTGAAAALLVFETPLSLKSLIRIRAPWLFVFAFVIGLGLLLLRQRVDRGWYSKGLMAVIVLFAATAPMVTADNYYDLDPRPTAQTSFSDQEVAELRATAEYTRTSEAPMTGFWLTRQTMERYGIDDVQTAGLRGETVIIPAGHFIYRSNWPNHPVQFTTADGDDLYSNTLFISQEWLDQRVATGNKVFTAGGTGIMWKSGERPFGEM